MKPEPGLLGPVKAMDDEEAWVQTWLRAGERQMRRIARAAAAGKAGPVEDEAEWRAPGRDLIEAAAALIIDPLR